MDPFTIATSVAKITSTCLTTGKAIYDFSCKYQDAPRNMVAISSEAAVISASLSQIQALILTKPQPEHLLRSRPEIATTLDTCLTGCMVLFSCLDEELRSVERHARGRDKFSWVGRLKTVWKQETFQELLDGIRGQQLAINTLIQLLQMDSMIEISNLLQRNAPALKETVERTESLRRSHPSVRVAESIYNREDRMSIYSTADSVMASSELEFDFDDIIVNSAAYRRALAAARHQQQPAVPPTLEVEGDLIDFSDNATLKQVPLQNEDVGIAAISDDLLDLTFVTNVDELSFADDVSTQLKHINSSLDPPASPGATALESQADAQLIRVKRKPLTVSDQTLQPPVTNTAHNRSSSVTPEQRRFSFTTGDDAATPKTPLSDDSHLLKSSQSPTAVSPRLAEPSSPLKICAKCNQILGRKFVRALDNIYHLECFTCQDCGKNVASKFFPFPAEKPHHFALCEHDFFQRLDLICAKCDNALRGSYVTALGKKYHVDHFTCTACPKLFGKDDSYYDEGGKPYCFEHFASWYAQQCHGCSLSVLKQYVEIFQGGQNQNWHPECYMIHKYWRVKMRDMVPIMRVDNAWTDKEGRPVDAAALRQYHDETEERINKTWTTLSTFEEQAATAISDMLLALSNGQDMTVIPKTVLFLTQVHTLFNAMDSVVEREASVSHETRRKEIGARETKLLCKKVVTLLSMTLDQHDQAVKTAVSVQKVTQEMLSVVTGLAHYLKLVIRVALNQALNSLDAFIADMSIDTFVSDVQRFCRIFADLATTGNDVCQACRKAVEDACYTSQDKPAQFWHRDCFTCLYCHRPASPDPADVPSDTELADLCEFCSAPRRVVYTVTRLTQYLNLLWVALARSMSTVKYDVSQLQNLRLEDVAGKRAESSAQIPRELGAVKIGPSALQRAERTLGRS